MNYIVLAGVPAKKPADRKKIKLSILKQVGGVIQHMHDDQEGRIGFMHRDIRPENILVDKFCQIKVIDLEFATKQQTDTIFCGDPEFIAPEMLSSDLQQHLPRDKRPAYTKSVDVWAFGVLAWKVLSVSGFSFFYFSPFRVNGFGVHSRKTYWDNVLLFHYSYRIHEKRQMLRNQAEREGIKLNSDIDEKRQMLRNQAESEGFLSEFLCWSRAALSAQISADLNFFYFVFAPENGERPTMRDAMEHMLFR